MAQPRSVSVAAALGLIGRKTRSYSSVMRCQRHIMIALSKRALKVESICENAKFFKGGSSRIHFYSRSLKADNGDSVNLGKMAAGPSIPWLPTDPPKPQTGVV
ncbi:hypothetical protein J3D46_004766 [Paenarthrobacter sp. A20]|nr:hypothetical protein [Paenarthrobacter sp. A20]